MTKRRATRPTTARKRSPSRVAKAKPKATARPAKGKRAASTGAAKAGQGKRGSGGVSAKAIGGKPPAERLTALEVKLAYLEYTVEKLDGVIRLQQEQIDRLERRLGDLEGRPWEGTGFEATVPDEPPPHY